MNYKDLNINQKINIRSGFDIAIAREGKLCNGKLYTRYSESIRFKTKCYNNVYDIDRFAVSLRTLLNK